MYLFGWLGIIYFVSMISGVLIYALWDSYKRWIASKKPMLTWERSMEALNEYLHLPSVRKLIEQRDHEKETSRELEFVVPKIEESQIEES